MNEFCKKYLELITTEFSGLNLTRITTMEDFYSKQFMDSTLPFQEFPDFKQNLLGADYILDIGFGGGFPILPLASLHELRNKNFIGIESIEKKVKAVDYIARKLEIKNILLHKERVENILIDLPRVIILSKAVASIEKFISFLNYSKTITVYFYKGPKISEEMDIFVKKYDQFLDWKIVEDSQYRLPSGEIRYMLGLELGVPHRTKQKKYKYKFSELVSGV